MKPKNHTLAVTAPADLTQLQYPIAAQPKIDGVCGLGGQDGYYSRRLKLFPNRAVQRKYLEALARFPALAGLHGEIITDTDGVFDPAAGKWNGQPLCTRTSANLMTIDGHDRIEMWAFDMQGLAEEQYHIRHQAMSSFHEQGMFPDWVKIVPVHYAVNAVSLEAYVATNSDLGFEGTVVKSLNTPYKFGRSTEKQGQLMRITVTKTDEAVIVGAKEEMVNANEATVSETGHSERSTHKAGLVPNDTLGALELRGIGTGPESMWVDTLFSCGTGFDDKEKARLWALHKEGKLEGQIVTYEHKPHGSMDAPRFPAYKGIRHPDDM